MAFRPSRRQLAGGVVVLAIVVGALFVSPRTALERTRSVAQDPILFGAVLLGLYLVRPLFAWPTTILAVAAGYGFGFVGVPIALVGVALTTVPPFLAARWFGRGADLGRVSETSERYFAATGDFRGVVAARLVPIPADVATCAAGLGDVRFRSLIAGTVVGEIPWTVAAVAVGTSADRLATGDLGSIALPLAMATILVAAVLLAGPAGRSLLRDRG
jgi:uncharacterized membrane protein YdjX (TVP38/TMEM64 family)